MLTTLLPQTPESEELLTRSEWVWLDAPPAWLLGLVLIPGLIALVWWSYRRLGELERGPRLILVVCRFLALFLILVLSFRPALQTTKVLRERNEIHVLVDDSASMDRREPYEAERAQAYREALGNSAPSDLGTLSRVDLVRRILGGGPSASTRATGPGKALLSRLEKDFDFRWFRFAERVEAVPDLEGLQAKGNSTRIGDSLDLHLGQARAGEGGSGRLEAVILVSDGRSNQGLPAREVAARYRAQQIPVHTIGVGDPRADRNLVLSGPPGPQQVLVHEEAVFDLDVKALGLAGRDGRLELEGFRRMEGGSAGPVVPMQSTSFVVPEDGAETKVRIVHRFEEPGDYILSFQVPPLPGESNPGDNRTRHYLWVDSDRIRVLYLEEQPRWEYRYLKNALGRVDKSIEYQALMFDASRDYVQESSEDLPALQDLPRTRKELFAYDVILLGDVPPHRLGKDPEERGRFLELLRDFVEHGGGLGVIAGELAMPERYRESPIEDLLPVVLDPFGDGGLPTGDMRSFRPLLENPANPHPILQHIDENDENRLLWERGLEDLTWYFPVLRAKAGATVLLRHPRDENAYGRRGTRRDLSLPQGHVAWFGFDDTWRWRYGYQERYFDPYWRRVVRSLGQTRLSRMDDRIQLQVDRERIEVGDRVRVQLKLLDEDYNPILTERAKIHLGRPGGETTPLELPRMQGRPGEFESEVGFDEPGVFSLLVYRDGVPGDRPGACRDVIVKVPAKELSEPSLDETGLREIAEVSGGRYADLYQADELLPALADMGGGQKIVQRERRQVWDSAWVLLLVLALLTVEWILRKRWNLL